MIITKRIAVILTEPVDFSVIVRELEAFGLSQVEIAAQLQVSQPAISRLRSGHAKTCFYEFGADMIKLRDLMAVLDVL